MSTKKQSLRQLLSGITAENRIKLAKAKTERVVDHVRYLLELHENNEIVLYSSPPDRDRALVCAMGSCGNR